jgi:hypothetical protein
MFATIMSSMISFMFHIVTILPLSQWYVFLPIERWIVFLDGYRIFNTLLAISLCVRCGTQCLGALDFLRPRLGFFRQNTPSRKRPSKVRALFHSFLPRTRTKMTFVKFGKLVVTMSTQTLTSMSSILSTIAYFYPLPRDGRSSCNTGRILEQRCVLSEKDYTCDQLLFQVEL